MNKPSVSAGVVAGVALGAAALGAAAVAVDEGYGVAVVDGQCPELLDRHLGRDGELVELTGFQQFAVVVREAHQVLGGRGIAQRLGHIGTPEVLGGAIDEVDAILIGEGLVVIALQEGGVVPVRPVAFLLREIVIPMLHVEPGIDGRLAQRLAGFLIRVE